MGFVVVESRPPFATIADFPAQTPIFTYPTGFTPAGALQVHAAVKESLLAELEAQLAGVELPLRIGTASNVERDAAGDLVVVLRSDDTESPAKLRRPTRERRAGAQRQPAAPQ